MASVHKNIYLSILVRLYMMCFVRANAFLQLAPFQDFAINLIIYISIYKILQIFFMTDMKSFIIQSFLPAVHWKWTCALWCCFQHASSPAFISVLRCYSSMFIIWRVLFWAHGLSYDYGPVVFGSTRAEARRTIIFSWATQKLTLADDAFFGKLKK